MSMAAESIFEWTCSQLEEGCSLDRLEARGTVRLALKEAGLDAKSVSPTEMATVFRKLMPRELETRGIESVAGLCENIAVSVEGIEAGPSATTSPEDVFARLGGQA
jgi:hypothetical protein